MLQTLRRRALNLATKLFLFVIVLSFALWGVGDMVRGVQRTDVATVGDQKISLQEYQQELRAETARYRALLGKDATNETLEKLGLSRMVVDNLITRRLLVLEMESLGLALPDEVIARRIAGEKLFQDESGAFSKARFQQVLRQAGLSEAMYVDSEKRELTRQFLLEALRAAPPEPGKIAELLHSFRGETRDVTVFRLPLSSIKGVPSPTDEELAQYHRDHQASFTAPEYRSFTYLVITPDMFAAESPPTDEELREEYLAHEAEYGQPEKRRVLQALFQDEDAAKAAREDVKQGKGTTDLGAVSAADLPEKALADAVFAAPEGGVTQPVQSAFGWHVFKIEKILPGNRKSFEEVKDAIRAKLIANRGVDQAYKAVSRVEDALAGGATIEEVAQQLGAATHSVSQIEASGKRSDGAGVSGLPLLPEALPVAFATEEKEISPVTQASQNRFFVLRVDGVTPARSRTLEEVRGHVVAAWQEARKRELLAARAKEARNALAENGQLPASAERRSYAGLKRNEPPKELSPLLAAAAFGPKPGGVSEPVAEEDGASFVQVNAVHPGAAKEGDVARLAEELQGQYVAEGLEYYLRYLRQKHRVEIHRVPGLETP